MLLQNALRIVDSLANGLPPTQVVDPLIGLCQSYSASPDPSLRKAAIAAFGMVFEGCNIYLQPHLNELWPFMERSLTDPSPIVRKAACVALGYACEASGEECVKHHESLLPVCSREEQSVAQSR
jgi:importin-4